MIDGDLSRSSSKHRNPHHTSDLSISTHSIFPSLLPSFPPSHPPSLPPSLPLIAIQHLPRPPLQQADHPVQPIHQHALPIPRHTQRRQRLLAIIHPHHPLPQVIRPQAPIHRGRQDLPPSPSSPPPSLPPSLLQDTDTGNTVFEVVEGLDGVAVVAPEVPDLD